MRREFDLEDRLVDFAVDIIRLTDNVEDDKAGRHVSGQILRSGTSPAPNYGEAQGAESRDDFIHKLKVCLKELRETSIWLKVCARAELVHPAEKLDPLRREADELVAIIFTSIDTARKRGRRGK